MTEFRCLLIWKGFVSTSQKNVPFVCPFGMNRKKFRWVRK